MAKELRLLVLAFAVVISGHELFAATSGYLLTNAFAGLTFTNPVCLAAPPGENNRLFIAEKKGRIVVITNLAAPTRSK